MDQAKQRVISRQRVKERIKRKVHGTAARPRLAVFRSLKHIYAQVIDDASGGKGANAAAAKAVGALIAKKAQDKGVKQVVFDRGGYQFHGNIKALADAASDNGLEF